MGRATEVSSDAEVCWCVVAPTLWHAACLFNLSCSCELRQASEQGKRRGHRDMQGMGHPNPAPYLHLMLLQLRAGHEHN